MIDNITSPSKKKPIIIIIILIALAIVFNVFDFGKDSEIEEIEKQTEESTENNNTEEVFSVVDEMPVFSGGDEALFSFLGENITYPKIAADKGIERLVYVSFVIDENGAVQNAEVLKGIGEGCDEEALRVVKAMPNWTAGKLKGENVKVKYTLPVRFLLQ